MDLLHEGIVETLPGSWAPPGGRPVELVFRTVGERTSDLALQLALEHVRPSRAHVLRDVKPFALAVRRMLTLPHECSHVVHMDADCLILEDLRPFLDANDLPYVDCYVRDRFRGRIHCGVHVTSIEVVRKMAEIPEPQDDLAYVLRPESRLRNLALSELGYEKQLKSFQILHDHFQRYTDIFCKYALRELRSRTDHHKKRLEASMGSWGGGVDLDVARHAVRHATASVPFDAKPKYVEAYIRNLPYTAEIELRKLGLSQSAQVGIDEVRAAVAADPVALGPAPRRPKVFGIGLSRTGTRSLTAALHVLGWDTAHYPTDAATLETLVRGDGRFPLLAHYDGITDITCVPSFEQLDRLHPGAKFVLTVRDEQSWLEACHAHWLVCRDRAPGAGVEHRRYDEIRDLLRMAVYGTRELEPERLVQAYRAHVERVKRHFAGRPGDLLVLDIVGGEGYAQLASFLGVSAHPHAFPHKGMRPGGKAEKHSADD